MKKGNGKASGRFLRLDHDMLASEAWQSLDALASAILVEMSARYNGRNNGEISYSCREAERRFRVGRPTVIRALERLQSAGFVSCTEKGWIGQGYRRASRWRLSHIGTLQNQ